MAIQLLITDKNLVPQGDPLGDDWTGLDVTRKWNEPAEGSVSLPAYPEIVEQLASGNRLVVIRDKKIWTAGPMEVPDEIEIGYAGGDAGQDTPPPGMVTINFTDDLGRIAGYITWPDPALAWASQPAGTDRTITDNAELIIRQLINENCGPGARADRRIEQLILGAIAGAGSSTTITTRFEALLDAGRRAATAGGEIGFRTRQDGGQIIFECYQPRDMTATARFSFGLGNLRYVSAKTSAPTCTHALVAGTESDTTPATRTFVEVADTAAAGAWWRVEKFVDGSAADDTAGELTQAGNGELATDGPSVELQTVTVDTDDLKAGRDFQIGDQVAVALPTGLQVVDLVRSDHLQASPDTGEYVTSVVGSADATTDPAFVALVRELDRRLGRIAVR